MILEEAGRKEEAVACLDKLAKQIVDKLGMSEQLARLHTDLGNTVEATAVFKVGPSHSSATTDVCSASPRVRRSWRIKITACVRYSMSLPVVLLHVFWYAT